MMDANISGPKLNSSKRVKIFPLEEKVLIKFNVDSLTTENIENILSQAMRTKNENVIQQCLQLQENQKEIVKNTIIKMPLKEAGVS